MLLFDILLAPLDNLLASLYKSAFVFVNKCGYCWNVCWKRRVQAL